MRSWKHKRYKRRQEEAMLRKTERNKLTSKQQLQNLDFRLGIDIGATKERLRLAKLEQMKTKWEEISTVNFYNLEGSNV